MDNEQAVVYSSLTAIKKPLIAALLFEVPVAVAMQFTVSHLSFSYFIHQLHLFSWPFWKTYPSMCATTKL